ncbi:MAG: Lrp/AsnC ligand binding domain-containing protein [Thermoproteota archaeon]|nr:Lrp/AsnC ligand binding domain-containing protein [Candidatus Brockarchaeota archaeon]
MKYIVTLKDREGWEETIKKLLEIEEIEEIYMVTGPEDIILLLSISSDENLEWVRKKIRETGKAEEVRVLKVVG